MTDSDKNTFDILYINLLKEQYRKQNKGSLEGFEQWLEQCKSMCDLMCN